MLTFDPRELKAPERFNFATDVFDQWARVRPKAPALWWVGVGRGRECRYMFAELARLSRQAARLFQSRGLGRGDRVLIMLPRIPVWWVSMLGLIRLGAVPVPATTLLTSRDLAFRIESARVRGLITHTDGLAKVGGFEGIRFMAGGASPGWVDLEAGLSSSAPDFDGEATGANDPGILYFTSATAGEPKMVLHTQASYGLGHRLTGSLWLDLQPEDLHWNISDLGWGKAAWSSFYGPWQMGACVFALEAPGKFDPALTLDTLEQFPISTWCAPPTALRLIVREDLSRRRFPRLRHCVSAGEPLNPEVFRLWRSATGLTLHEAYGQTESVVLIGNFRCLGGPVQPGSMGRANPAFDLALLDERLAPVPDGREGEIAVRVKPRHPLGLFHGYWLNPEETARQFRGPWYLTGDRAIRTPDGYYWFVGRRDDVIKSSGYRIGPFEVESALLEHPAVLDAAVVGKPDQLRGQIVKAFVVLRPHASPGPDVARELQRHCKSAAAPYKYPREIEFVADLPKTASGKTRRVELRQRHLPASDPGPAG